MSALADSVPLRRSADASGFRVTADSCRPNRGLIGGNWKLVTGNAQLVQKGGRHVKKIAATSPCPSANAVTNGRTKRRGRIAASARKAGNKVDVRRPIDSTPPASTGGTMLMMTKTAALKPRR